MNCDELEKISQLPRKLSIDGVAAGDDPFPRHIGYYNPSGDLVFYYGDVGYFNGIVRIGQFDGAMDALTSQTGDFTARIGLRSDCHAIRSLLKGAYCYAAMYWEIDGTNNLSAPEFA